MTTAILTESKTKWVLDPAHSELVFKVKHLMISTVTGQFRKFNVTAETENDDFTNPKEIEFVAEVDSIDTNNEQRDGHLRSADFFEAEKYSQIVFKGSKYEVTEDAGKLYGELTIRDTTKKIVLDVEPGGIAIDPYGQTKAAFSVSGKISRKEFGLTWHAVTETGGVIVGDDIKFQAEIQLIKQA
jgi:polyisoprenoid-binding protein YceI